MGVSDVELSSTMVMTLKNKLGKEKSCFEIGSYPKHCNSVKKKVNKGRFSDDYFPFVRGLGSPQQQKIPKDNPR